MCEVTNLIIFKVKFTKHQRRDVKFKMGLANLRLMFRSYSKLLIVLQAC